MTVVMKVGSLVGRKKVGKKVVDWVGVWVGWTDDQWVVRKAAVTVGSMAASMDKKRVEMMVGQWVDQTAGLKAGCSADCSVAVTAACLV